MGLGGPSRSGVAAITDYGAVAGLQLRRAIPDQRLFWG